MGNFVFNISKGRGAYYGTLPQTNDAIIVIPIEASGVEADSVLVDYADVSTLLAAATNEQTTLGRKTVTSATVTVDNTNDRVDVDIADQTWPASAGNPISDLLFAYDNDTTSGTDSNLVPMTWHDFVATPDGSDLTAAINVFYRAS